MIKSEEIVKNQPLNHSISIVFNYDDIFIRLEEEEEEEEEEIEDLKEKQKRLKVDILKKKQLRNEQGENSEPH